MHWHTALVSLTLHRQKRHTAHVGCAEEPLPPPVTQEAAISAAISNVWRVVHDAWLGDRIWGRDAQRIKAALDRVPDLAL